MAETFACWQCGEDLINLILPLSRRDECRYCGAQQHVCRLCTEFNPTLSNACEQDQAEDVGDKETANFCDFFKPNSNAFRPKDKNQESAVESELATLFGAEENKKNNAPQPKPTTRDEIQAANENARSALDDLFGKK